jgi:D-tyrosyl-tRNA(Tyr) deacylase
MKAVIQRVSHAQVTVGGEIVGSTDAGLLVLLGIAKGDTTEDAGKLALKIARMRIFSDDEGKLNLSLEDIAGGLLVVSNFTLCGNCAHGARPDFTNAAGFEEARSLYHDFMGLIQNLGITKCESGRFGADMQVSLVGDGPVTIILDTDSL